MVKEPTTLAVLLHGKRIGLLNQLAGERFLFSFDQEYVDSSNRPTLSLSFKSTAGGLLTTVRPSTMRLPPFFSNLLPEGALRDYLAAKAGVKSTREFLLLFQLGSDLPGAVTVEALDHQEAASPPTLGGTDTSSRQALLKFSLAGVQMKLSALMKGKGHLIIPANGIGGDWILKLPSPHYPAIAENEYAMMELARQVGIDVPETQLVAVSEIAGLPSDIARITGQALAIRRFDRLADGRRVHMEDFAQVFGIYPDNKYEGRSYANIAAVLVAEVGDSGTHEFVRRLVFSTLIGNGDMHLKNWTLLYPDERSPKLSPAYDLLATTPYLPDDKLALTFGGTKDISGVTLDQIRRFADKAGLAVNPLWVIAQETSARVRDAWRDLPAKDLLPTAIRDMIGQQIERSAI